MKKFTPFLYAFLSFFIFQNVYGQDYLESDYSSASATTTDASNAWSDITSVTINLGVANSNTKYVLVTASMNMRSDGSGTNDRQANYRIYRSGASSDNSGVIKREVNYSSESGVQGWGIGTLVYIFDATSLSGSVTYVLEHSNQGTAGSGSNIYSQVNLTAVALSTENNHNELSNDVKSTTGDVKTTSTSFGPVSGLETDEINLPITGSIIVMASINSTSATAGAVGYYKLRYSTDNGSNWSDLGKVVTRSITNANDEGIVSLTGLLENQPATGTNHYKFRVSWKSDDGTEIITHNSNLVAVALTHSDGSGNEGFFPAFYSEVGSNGKEITGVSTAATTVTSTSFKSGPDIGSPVQHPNLYVVSQYQVSASGLDESASPPQRMRSGNQLYITDGTTTNTADEYFRYIPNNSSFGSGGFIGLVVGMTQNTKYTIGMKHEVNNVSNPDGTEDETLTTSQVILTGFQTTDQQRVNWSGPSDTDWGNASNWASGSVPDANTNVVIPSGASNYPSVDETATCRSVTIESGGQMTIGTGAALSSEDFVKINGTLYVNDGSMTTNADITVYDGGTFNQTGGNVTISGNSFYSQKGSTVSLTGGTLDIGKNWKSTNGAAKGTITLGGSATINIDYDCRFAHVDCSGTMTGSFNMNIGDDFKMSHQVSGSGGSTWNTVDGGTITLTGANTKKIDVYSATTDYEVRAYNLIINADNADNVRIRTTSDGHNQKLYVLNDFTVTNCKSVLTKNGTSSHANKIQIDGTFTIASGQKFYNGVKSGETFSVGTYSFDASSEFHYYGNTAQDMITSATYGNLYIAAEINPVSSAVSIASDLQIETGGKLTLSNGAQVTVGGNLTNSVGTSGLIIKSTSAGTGSLIVEGTSSGGATVERYLSYGTSGRWYFVSPSTTGVTAQNFYDAGANDSWLSYFVESEGTNNGGNGEGWHYITDVSTAINVGQGYSYWPGSDETVSFEGNLRTTSLSPSISYSGTDYGYNLLGNPFASAVTWNSSWSTSNIENTIWIYDGSNYQSYSQTATHDIPVGQAFFVRANGSTPSITIPESQRTHSTQAFLKSGKNEGIGGYTNVLILTCQNNGATDRVQISFEPNGTTGFENGWDGTKMFGPETSPQLYLTEGEFDLSYDNLPVLTENKPGTVAMSYIPGAEGTQTLIADTEYFHDADVMLEDLKTGTFQDLKQKPVYTFTASKTDDPARFLLHFAWAPDGIDENETAVSDINVYARGKNVYVRSVAEAVNQKGKVFVYDLYGREITHADLQGGELERIPVMLCNTYVIVKVVKAGNSKTAKLFIK